jgi:glycosyltransferase involved in cell wall biosynthesis
MRVLMSAYACEADKGSEPGHGWSWGVAMAARGHDVTVMTRPECRPANDDFVAGNGIPTGMQIEYVCKKAWRRPPRLLGRRAHFIYGDYVAWQSAALERARRMHGLQPFDVVHHTTWGSIIFGSPLWRLPIPFIFGPVGGGQRTPIAARPYFQDGWRAEQFRNLSVKVTRWNPVVRSTLAHARTVLVTNDDTEALARLMGARDVRPFPDFGVERVTPRGPRRAGPLRILWVGGSFPRKGLAVALEAVAKARDQVELELVIAGGGPHAHEVNEWIRTWNLADTARYLGVVPFLEMQRLYASGDILLFTSLRDSLGTQLLEAAAAGLPLIAFDLHGVKTHMPATVAMKVPLELGADGIASAIVTLARDGERRRQMGEAARAFATEHTWDAHAEAMETIYMEALCART